MGLVLDLTAYSIISEDNASQYYPEYAYNHPLFSNGMHIYSDSKVLNLLQSMMEEMSVGFLNDWNSNRDHREKRYNSYDLTNKNCQAGDIEIVEFGHPKTDCGLPVFNYAIAYDTTNREALFYEKYRGSINDVSQMKTYLMQHTNEVVSFGPAFSKYLSYIIMRRTKYFSSLRNGRMSLNARMI